MWRQGVPGGARLLRLPRFSPTSRFQTVFFLKSLKYQRSDANCSEVFEMLLHDQVTLGQRAGGLGGLRPQLMW